LLEEYNSTHSHLNQITKELIAGLVSIELDNVEDAINIRLKDNVYLAYDKQHATMQQEVQRATTQLELQQKEFLQLKENISLESQEEVHNNLKNKLEDLEKLKQQEKELSFFLRNQERLKKEIEAIEKEM